MGFEQTEWDLNSLSEVRTAWVGFEQPEWGLNSLSE